MLTNIPLLIRHTHLLIVMWFGERTHGEILLQNREPIILHRLHSKILRELLLSFQALLECLHAFRVVLGVGRICHLHCELHVNSIFKLSDDNVAAQGLHQVEGSAQAHSQALSIFPESGRLVGGLSK